MVLSASTSKDNPGVTGNQVEMVGTQFTAMEGASLRPPLNSFSSFFLVLFLTKQHPMRQPPVTVVLFVGINYMNLVRACSRKKQRVSANGQYHILSLSAVTGVSVTSLKTKMIKVLRENKASYVDMGIIEGVDGLVLIQYVKVYTTSRPEN